MSEESKKILVVDDDQTIIALVEENLSKEGFNVITAKDGLDAMVLVKNESPDLIVLDVMMPELNGFEVCQKLKFDDEYKHIPIIILTARDQELDPHLGGMMGIDYLQKPFHHKDLMDKVSKNLKNS